VPDRSDNAFRIASHARFNFKLHVHLIFLAYICYLSADMRLVTGVVANLAMPNIAVAFTVYSLGTGLHCFVNAATLRRDRSVDATTRLKDHSTPL
jgi:hypothetical protein